MGDSRDSNQKPSSSFETEDDSGLELSLGLSCGRFINKAKGENSVKELNFDGGKEKEKNGKTCLGNASLKLFQQRSIGEEEDNGKQQAGSLPQQQEIFWTSLETNTSKEPEKLIRMHMNEVQFPVFGEVLCAAETSELWNASPQQILLNSVKNTHAESPGTPVSKNYTDTMPRDLLFSPHIAATGGQFTQPNLPAHFVDPFRNGSPIAGNAIVQSRDSTASVMQNSFQLVGTQSPSLGLKPSVQHDTSQGKQCIGTENVNADWQQRQSVPQQQREDDILEQNKKRETSAQKWQEARKKRKQLIEEQKQQKKAKKEDERAGPQGFRRPGSNTWVRGWEPSTASVADIERSKTTQDMQEEGNQMPEKCCNLQRGREKNREDNELETDEESSESHLDESDISDNSLLPSVKADEVGRFLSNARESGRLPKSNKDLTEAQQCMTAGIDGLQKTDEKEEQNCRKSTSVGLGKPPLHCTTFGNNSNTCTTFGNNSNTAVANLPTTTPITMTNTALPYSVPSFPVMPAPYSLPTPVPNHPNVPFPVGYPFVYLMQYPPPAVDGSNSTAARPPIYPNGFQLPLGYAPFQLPTLEASPSWVPVLRPQQSPAFSPNFGGGSRTTSEPVEDETKVSQGVKCHDKQKNQVALSTDDSSKQTNCSLNRSDSLHNIQDQCAGSGQSILSTLSTIPGTSLGLSQAQSGTRKTFFFTEHGSVPADKRTQGPIATGLAIHETIKTDPESCPQKDEKKLEIRDLDNSNVGRIGMISKTIQKDSSGHVVAGPNMTNDFPQVAWNLRPGIACGMSFGGSGTTPELPWVSTTGAGPNGKTICGVLYRNDASQVRIVCACHSRHLSPNEFIQHASIAEASNPEKTNVVNPYVIGSEAATAHG